LAIQGDVEAHAQALERLGASTQPVLREKHLAEVDALVLPGGESTTMAKGLDRLGLYGPLHSFAQSGRPILGTCAGAILLAKASENHPVRTLGLIDLVAHRNSYGTQVDSFAAGADDPGEGAPEAVRAFSGLRCVFIRAPRLADLAPEVEILVRVEGAPVLVRRDNVIVCTFHPELGRDPRVHQLLDRS
jgi:5'-phosphate synthase pdxT subunit